MEPHTSTVDDLYLHLVCLHLYINHRVYELRLLKEEIHRDECVFADQSEKTLCVHSLFFFKGKEETWP